jgi:hypothetical protein
VSPFTCTRNARVAVVASQTLAELKKIRSELALC